MMEEKRNHLHRILLRCLLCVVIALLLCSSAFAMEGTGTETDPYIITTAEDLAAMHNDLSGHYVLGCNIDLTGYQHTPIGNEEEGAFTGSFDGKGFTLSNLTIKDGSKYVGLFGYLEGTVLNVQLKNVSVIGSRYVGAVAGCTAETAVIADCRVLSGSVSCEDPLMTAYAGGITGYCRGLLQGRLHNGADVVLEAQSNSVYAGGLAGYAGSRVVELISCTNSGKISTSTTATLPTAFSYAGGMIGYASAQVQLNDCTNSGEIFSSASTSNATYKVSFCVGGMIGYASTQVQLNGCVNSSNISFPSSSSSEFYFCAGGMIGTAYSNASMDCCSNSGNISRSLSTYGSSFVVGGMIGTVYSDASLNNCSNSGDVSSNSTCAGGMIGDVSSDVMVILKSCINSGTISTSSGNRIEPSSGGMIGYADSYSNISMDDCSNRGNIHTYSSYYSSMLNTYAYAGGLVGYAGNISFERCRNSGDISASKIEAGTRLSLCCGAMFGKARPSHQGTTFNTGNIQNNMQTYISKDNELLITSRGITISPLDAASYRCSDTRYTSSHTGTPKSFAGLQNAALYPNWDTKYGWTIDSDKNSGLPFPEDARNDLLNESILFLRPDETAQLEAEFEVDHWTAFNPAIATCENGLITAVAPGSAGASAYNADGSHRGNCIIFVYQPQEQMTVSAAATALNKGETTQMSTDLYDAYPDDPQGLIWSSSDPSIATVDVSGKVTAVGGGEVTITGYAPLSDISASCTITVTAPITSLNVPSSVTINAGTPTKLAYTVSPDPFTGILSWKSTDESVATVEDGVVTGHKPGMCIITATSDTGLEKSCTVTVVQPSGGIQLSETEVTLEVGFTHELVAILIPENSTDSITWNSSNTSVATVANGVLTAKRAGQTLITATTTSGQKAYCTVTVVNATTLPSSISLNQQSWRAKIGEKLQLTATVLPTNATDRSVKWSSSAPEVAEVSSTGVVTAVGSGKAVITATTHNGFFAECEVKVAVTSSAAFELGDRRATVGETVEIPVYIHRNPGIAAFTVTLDYDKAVMTPLAVTAGDLLSAGTFETNLSDENRSQLHLTWYDAENLTENGLAFTITMQVADTVSAGTYNVGLSYEADDICDADKSSVAFAVESAQIKIVDYLIGDIYVDGKVGMKDIVLLCRYINDLEDLSGDQLLAADVYYDGNVDVKDLVELAQILMNQTPAAVQTFGIRAFAADENTLSGRIKIEASEPDHNGNVKITVSVSESADMAAFRFGLDALTEYLQINNIVQGADLTDGTFQYQCNADGVPVVLWYDSVSRTIDGEIFVIYATVKDGTKFGDYAIDLSWDADDICSEAFSNITLTADAAEVDYTPNLLISDAEMTVEEKDVSIQVDFTSNARSSYSAIAILGFYENGRMVGTKIMPVEIHGDQADIAVTVDYEFTQCKLFVLESATTWIPIANATEVGS